MIRKKQFITKIKYNLKAGSGLYIMALENNDGIVSEPGQFISLLCPSRTLRRPISILDNDNGEIKLLYKVRGEGTKYFSTLQSGDEIDFTGPFGNNFVPRKRTLLLGAGVGIAPVFYMAKKLKVSGFDYKLAAGFRTVGEIPLQLKADFDFITTDDGSYGEKGSIVTHIESMIKEFQPDTICICGPIIVMRLVTAIAENFNIQCQVSMENMMACSIGACRGCVIKIKNDGIIQNAAVCQQGPVFNGSSVFYEGKEV